MYVLCSKGGMGGEGRENLELIGQKKREKGSRKGRKTRKTRNEKRKETRLDGKTSRRPEWPEKKQIKSTQTNYMCVPSICTVHGPYCTCTHRSSVEIREYGVH